MLKKLLSRQGSSLVQVMVSVGIMSMIALFVATMISSAQKEQAALTEKLALLELQGLVVKIFADGDTCTKQLIQNVNNHNFQDLPTNYEISIPSIYLGSVTNPKNIAVVNQPLPGFPSNKLVVSHIKLKSISLGTSNTSFVADLEIAIKSDSLIRPLKPVIVQNISFSVLPNPTLSTAKILNCSSGDILTCPIGMTKITPSSTAGGKSFCIENNVDATTDSWEGAARVCFLRKRRLCNGAEWINSCESGAVSGMTGHWEWIAEIAGIGNTNVFVLGNAGCNDHSYADNATGLQFRCCID